MHCALCKQKRKLCKSHIIPQFLYGDLFERGKKAYAISTKRGTHTHCRPTGVYEKLLCGECERKFSKWESCASEVIYGGAALGEPHNHPRGLEFSGINYACFKLFELSLLWRAAVSKRDEFRNVQLCSRYLTALRGMLLNDDPGNPCDFGCMITASPGFVRNYPDLVVMPEMLQGEPEICRFVFGGMFWLYFVPIAPPDAERCHSVITRDGNLLVCCSDRLGSEYFWNVALELHNSGNLPKFPPSGKAAM